MLEFHIDLEWEEAPYVRSHELSATWARLEIHAGKVPITKVEDHRSRGVRNGIYVPLYPIAEWLVTNWWYLWNEWRLDRPLARHNLLAAREGFALPDLSFLPTETRMELYWRPKPAADCDRVSFLLEGSQVCSKALVSQELRRFIDTVVSRLNDRGVSGTFLAKEWAAIIAVEKDAAQRRFCEQAARLGLDPFDLPTSVAESLEQLDDLLPLAVIDDFCDAVSFHEIPTAAKAVADFLAEAKLGSSPNNGWLDLHESLVASNGLSPWQYGYKQAQNLRSKIGISGPIQGDLTAILRETLRSFEMQTLDTPAGIEAIAAPNRTDAPSFGIARHMVREESRRFVLCRALSDYLALYMPSLITRAQTEHQQRNRAFAAEFLAPAAAIRERISGDCLSEDDLEDLALEFRVSGFVIRHQVENHKLAIVGP